MRPFDEIRDAIEECDPSSQLRFNWNRAFPDVPCSSDSIMGWLMSEHGLKRSEASCMPLPAVIELLKASVRVRKKSRSTGKKGKPGRKRGDRRPDKNEDSVIKAHRHGQNFEVTAKAAKVFTKDGRPDVRRVRRIIRAYKAANPGHEFKAADS